MQLTLHLRLEVFRILRLLPDIRIKNRPARVIKVVSISTENYKVYRKAEHIIINLGNNTNNTLHHGYHLTTHPFDMGQPPHIDAGVIRTGQPRSAAHTATDHWSDSSLLTELRNLIDIESTHTRLDGLVLIPESGKLCRTLEHDRVSHVTSGIFSHNSFFFQIRLPNSQNYREAPPAARFTTTRDS